MNENGLYALCKPTIMSDHPSIVSVLKTESIDQIKVSKLFIEKLGL